MKHMQSIKHVLIIFLHVQKGFWNNHTRDLRLKVAETDMRYFVKGKFSKSLIHKKIYGLI